MYNRQTLLYMYLYCIKINKFHYFRMTIILHQWLTVFICINTIPENNIIRQYQIGKNIAGCVGENIFLTNFDFLKKFYNNPFCVSMQCLHCLQNKKKKIYVGYFKSTSAHKVWFFIHIGIPIFKVNVYTRRHIT